MREPPSIRCGRKVPLQRFIRLVTCWMTLPLGAGCEPPLAVAPEQQVTSQGMAQVVACPQVGAGSQEEFGAGEPPMSPEWVGWEQVRFVAHRGFGSKYPENTIEAVVGAIHDGAAAVEVDVRVSRDNVPILMHDGDVSRTTDGLGLVHTLTLDSIRKLNACPGRGARCSVPTLEEVLAVTAGHGVNVILDVKAGFQPAIVERMSSIVCVMRAESRVAVVAANAAVLIEWRRQLPRLLIGIYPSGPEQLDSLAPFAGLELLAFGASHRQGVGPSSWPAASKLPLALYTASHAAEALKWLEDAKVARVYVDRP